MISIMTQTRRSIKNLIVILLTSFLTYGFADVSINDVEMAIIGKEYGQAKQEAAQLLLQEPTDDQRDELRYYVGLCDLHLGEYAHAKKAFNELVKKKGNATIRDKSY